MRRCLWIWSFGLRCLTAAALTSLLALSACGGSGDNGSLDEQPKAPEPDPILNKEPVPPSTSLVCPKGTYLTYENFGAAFMANYCTSCHSSRLGETERGGAPANQNFDTAEDVQLWRAAILVATGSGAPTPEPDSSSGSGAGANSSLALAADPDEATPIGSSKMPPGDYVTDTDKAIFKEWMNCGAPTHAGK